MNKDLLVNKLERLIPRYSQNQRGFPTRNEMEDFVEECLKTAKDTDTRYIQIPKGQYKFPAGLLIVQKGERYPSLIKFVPRDHTIPEQVIGLTLYWTEDKYDGWELDYRDEGITEKEESSLPDHYLGLEETQNDH